VRLVRVPTTTLAQADAGVGVKCAVNAFGVKNFLGAFAPPFAVLIDSIFLGVQPTRERTAGMAEAVKVGLVRDARFFQWIEAHAQALAQGQLESLGYLVRRSAELHLDHIALGGDPFERGSARPLDFGHWAAHKLEALSEHRLRHGEAVAIGIALDAHVSHQSGLLDELSFSRIVALLEALGLPLWDDALATARGGRLAVLDGLEEFRQHLGGDLCVTHLERIGAGVDVGAVDARQVRDAVGWLARRASRYAATRAQVAG
jgi:3-dehydroquinate synthase